MKRKATLTTILLLMSISVLLLACSGHGKLRLQPSGPDKVTPEVLMRTWKNYEVYYSGLDSYKASAILFDPKGDTKTMTVHPWWVKVTDERMLQEVMDWMLFYIDFDPVIWSILGPNNDFYGYLYTPWSHALIRVVDENTLWIDEMSIPPDYRKRLGIFNEL